jgi:hypothetical protein
MVEHLRLETRGAREPRSDVARSGEESRRLAERAPVERLHLTARRAILRGLRELPELGAIELVCLPELVHEPDALLVMANDVRGELRRDHHVDPAPVDLLELDHPPQKGLREHGRARIPRERDRYEIRFVTARPQLGRQRVGEDLGAAVRKGDLWSADGDPHRPTLRARRLAPW